MTRAFLTWLLLASAQTAPSVAQWDARSPFGSTYPGERLLIISAWAALAQWLYALDERRSPRLYGAMLAALAAAVLTAPFSRTAHQPTMFAVQVLAAGQLWQWAGHERSAVSRTIATIQTVAAFLIFPATQLAYGPTVRPGLAGSALYAIAGPLPGLAVASLGSLAVGLAFRRDITRLGL